jgi:chromosome segregation protein
MLTKRREIKDLEHEVAELKTLASGLDSELVSLNAAIESDRGSETDLSQQIHRDEIELINRDKDGASVRDEISRASDRSRAVEAETAERASKRQELNASIVQSAETLRGLEAGHTSAQETIESLQAELSRHKDRLESARAEITEVRMALASLTEKQAAAARNVSLFLTAEAELAGRLEKRNAEIESISAKLTELEASIIEAESEIKGQIEVLDAGRTILIMKQEAYAEKSRIVQAAEEQARQKRHDLEAVQKRLSANEVRRTELRMKIEHLKDRIWTAYHTELETIVQELGQFELNVEQAGQQAGELREKIEQMGPINVDALQEYNELKERFDLLSSQQNDINESIANLKATIAKLDGETIDLFSEAFNVIQEKFKEVFALLFEGGKAELVLLDPSNILESGIEIIAQPRGKKFQSITLLSGGERALTAIALLFAAFLVKPSPFCMLDEVDAPLDEANVTRFTRLIREMSSRSQFITITHNKRTMEMADALYGITMEEPGCSRIISAKLREPALV